MIYLYNGAFVFESRTDIKKGITLLYYHFARFGLEMHIGTGKKHQTMNAYFPHPQVSLTHGQYGSLLSPPPTCTYRINKVIKRDAHTRTKNMPNARKQQLSS